MLVLNRKNGEEIRIGNNITIKIITASDGSVKLGIDAPTEVAILRGELYPNIKESVIQASKESNQSVSETQLFKINRLKDIEK